MKLTGLTPMLWVDDVQGTINYYVNTLGFAERNFSVEWQWGVVEKDNVVIMLAKPPAQAHFKGPSFTGSLYIRTDNIDTTWRHLKDKADIYYGIEDFEYGMREFAIKDCNGYILQFGQAIDKAETRQAL